MSHEAWMQDSVPQVKAIQTRIIQTSVLSAIALPNRAGFLQTVVQQATRSARVRGSFGPVACGTTLGFPTNNLQPAQPQACNLWCTSLHRSH